MMIKIVKAILSKMEFKLVKHYLPFPATFFRSQTLVSLNLLKKAATLLDSFLVGEKNKESFGWAQI